MKRFRNTIILSVLLALTLCVGAQATENTMLKVGLKYGTNALFTARLQNYNDTLSGSGYEFGYYDADRSFVPLAATDEQRSPLRWTATPTFPAASHSTRRRKRRRCCPP